MKKVLKALLGLLVIAGVLPLTAQEEGGRPAPNVLQIFREVVKPGRGPAHEKVEAGWPKAYRASKAAPTYLGMTSVTGPNEAWFLSGYPSFEAMQQQMKAEEADATLSAELARLSAADGELLENFRSITARFREDLSMRPSLNLGNYRYFNVVTVRVRPGMQDKFAEARKMVKAAHEKAGLKDYYSVFEVQSGMPGPTFLIFVPMKSLKELDESGPLHMSAAYREALGGDEADKKMRELASAAVLNNESAIFAFSPKMSLVPAEYVAGNASFWNPKPVMAATPKSKVVPAAKK